MGEREKNTDTEKRPWDGRHGCARCFKSNTIGVFPCHPGAAEQIERARKNDFAGEELDMLCEKLWNERTTRKLEDESCSDLQRMMLNELAIMLCGKLFTALSQAVRGARAICSA